MAQRFPSPHVYNIPMVTILPRVLQLLWWMNLREHRCHLKSVVYVRVHSWCYTVYGFGQTYNDMYSPFSLVFYYVEFVEGGVAAKATVKSMKAIQRVLSRGNWSAFAGLDVRCPAPALEARLAGQRGPRLCRAFPH